MIKQINPNLTARVKEQYHKQDNLKIRLQTHERFTVPVIHYPAWVLDNLNWTGEELVIDIGCGAGAYCKPALARCRTYIATDLSLGMLMQLPDQNIFRINLDASELPFKPGTADVILANHMLYHLPNAEKALNAMKRVLRKGGWLVTTTNSADYMTELGVVINQAGDAFNVAQLEKRAQSEISWPFTLENGDALLTEYFGYVKLAKLNSQLVFHQAEPVLAYISSSRDHYARHLPTDVRWSDFIERIAVQVNEYIDQQGYFSLNKHNGVFLCQK